MYSISWGLLMTRSPWMMSVVSSNFDPPWNSCMMTDAAKLQLGML
jgi:metal-sulfur cluster biosynthetic enzyme